MSVARQGADQQIVYATTGVRGVVQQQIDGVAASGCDWLPALRIESETRWPSGFYLVTITTADGAVAHAYFVVRAAARGTALLVLSTSTWSAYNNWGGPSFYTGGFHSSARRPLPEGFLSNSDPYRFRIAQFEQWQRDDARAFAATGYSQWCMAAGWANWESLFVAWAEAEGIAFDYATSQDLHRNPELLAGYSTYISVGHDEYWSAAMRDQVEGFIDAGGNAAFFSGNTSFWQARFDHNDEQLICYKNRLREDPHYNDTYAPALATMWCDPLIRRPENAMTGVSFSRGGYAHMPNAPTGTGGYQVWSPEHWAFDGLSLQPGAALGEQDIVVGYECDGCDLQWQNGRPSMTGADGTPANFEVLGTAPARLWETNDAIGDLDDGYIGELNLVAERLAGADTPDNRARFEQGHAVLGTFRRGKGQVFTTGCTDWAYGLRQPDVATVTRNVLKRFMG